MGTQPMLPRSGRPPTASFRCNSKFRRIRHRDVDGEHEIDITIVIEDLRFIFYLLFILILIVGIILTTLYEENYERHIKSIFGYSQLCVYLDFPPATYFQPTIYAFNSFFFDLYIIASIFRAWVAEKEEKISYCSRIMFQVAMAYAALSVMVFSTSLAVQPDDKNPTTMIVHTVPFANVALAMLVLQISVTWFGLRVAWKDLDLPGWFVSINIGTIILQAIVAVVKVAHQINSIGDMGEKGLKGKGWWWSVDGPAIEPFFTAIDWLFVATNLAYPMFQSLYFSVKGSKTHTLIFTIRDNRLTEKKN